MLSFAPLKAAVTAESGLRKCAVLCAVALCLISLSACTIKQKVDPVTENAAGRTLCVIRNPNVRAGFEETLIKELLVRGYTVKNVKKDSAAYKRCTYLTSYTARWSWHYAIYLAYARIYVYKKENGKLKQLGSALYDSRLGLANPEKFIDAEPKIRELVQKLFPRVKKG